MTNNLLEKFLCKLLQPFIILPIIVVTGILEYILFERLP